MTAACAAATEPYATEFCGAGVGTRVALVGGDDSGCVAAAARLACMPLGEATPPLDTRPLHRTILWTPGRGTAL